MTMGMAAPRAEAGEDTRGDEGFKACGKQRGQREDAEERDAQDDDRLSADLVGKIAPQYGGRENAEGAGAEEISFVLRGEIEGGRESRRRNPRGLDVKPFQKYDDGAEDKHTKGFKIRG